MRGFGEECTGRFFYFRFFWGARGGVESSLYPQSRERGVARFLISISREFTRPPRPRVM